MGILHYGATGIEVEFDDRVLAHLQLAIGAKLRRGESFFLSWRDDPKVGDGRSSIWLETSVPLAFSYRSKQPQEINKTWLNALTESADGALGMRLTDEPVKDGRGQARDDSEKR